MCLSVRRRTLAAIGAERFFQERESIFLLAQALILLLPLLLEYESFGLMDPTSLAARRNKERGRGGWERVHPAVLHSPTQSYTPLLHDELRRSRARVWQQQHPWRLDL